ncbi:primase C-terminal domain-containing protein [Alkaliphilus sp. B6464]|uniref:primase C-terminal domain-containing protein n=1 Tax=Alkaliphilus sp. B6464 TaxID=2731219 RepID=UPI001BA4E47A|nr:primase C-terminal domain-containing protein [Alkaliphilus sp. B6464]QUH22039.1 primase C-terminal domain-containing protein [Alkaliphilus sp. B6464]
MDFRNKKFEYVEIAEDFESNRNKFTKLSLAEKLTWSGDYKKQAWRTIYSYCDIKNTEVSYGGYYFESDIEDFELNRQIILHAVYHLNAEYNIPFNAFKFKLTNKSIWVELIPSVMGISPSYRLNEIFREITIRLNKVIKNRFNVKEPLDTKVYNIRQLTRLTGSYLPKSKRYVIELDLYELESMSQIELFSKAKYKKKVTYPQNDDFNISNEAFNLFKECKSIVEQRYKNKKQNLFINPSDNKCIKTCINNMEEIGVGEGTRNYAIFYTSIHFRDSGFTQDECLNRILKFIKNFDRNNIDRLSQIKATVKSAYKSKYKFSCKKVNEMFEDYCACTKCPYNKNIKDDVFIIYRRQIAVLIENNSPKSLYIALFKFMYDYYHKNNIDIKDSLIKKLIKLGLLVVSENIVKPNYINGSFLQIPNDFVNIIDSLNSEIILLSSILYSSQKGIVLNPRMNTESYAKKIGKTTRTIQRYFKALKERGLINDAKINLILSTVEPLQNNEIDNKTEIKEPIMAIEEFERRIIARKNKTKEILANEEISTQQKENICKIIFIEDARKQIRDKHKSREIQIIAKERNKRLINYLLKRYGHGLEAP